MSASDIKSGAILSYSLNIQKVFSTSVKCLESTLLSLCFHANNNKKTYTSAI